MGFSGWALIGEKKTEVKDAQIEAAQKTYSITADNYLDSFASTGLFCQLRNDQQAIGGIHFWRS